MSSVALKIVQSRLGGRVERCHSIPHQGSYSNAAHSWGVAMLMWYLFPADFERLAIYCIGHDVPEGWVGDVPAPTLRHTQHVRAELAELERLICQDLGLPYEGHLSPEDHAKLKACDRLELYLWCCEQLALGNVYAAEPLKELEAYFLRDPLPEPALAFFQQLQGRSPIGAQAGVVRDLVERASAKNA